MLETIGAPMIQLPNKSHFKADEVCGFTGVKPYVLRFWETEFDSISPVVSSSGQKLYEQSDVEAILEIKRLLFDDKMTVEQARHEMSLRKETPSVSDFTENEMPSARTELQGFGANDLKKLGDAKILLQELVGLTQNIQQRHNWL
ncbi:MAG: hypothetical protein COW01_00615 [Bdellovibrionales bacterium CG12_big_fil_rev_8_21_14_0_65_38_15]|nr:MAG: hypothetical protein COW79_10150 [Bdellovibrionales bacterium CG22_combo_CG10-13_8_21_14_all_38_13]PIQ57469.1 MAG: hypothetical protein COW01_00615 [Bdellovibrionales bacterium CG12_big_fil_rev_8_21_14_0_65_38_15]PIR31190.1 MAG: hypothetical protein COV38_02095 [Bdellovibrionales bacterium CG11_big_fil_rev_8_21_14_0_20_38_13]